MFRRCKGIGTLSDAVRIGGMVVEGGLVLKKGVGLGSKEEPEPETEVATELEIGEYWPC